MKRLLATLLAGAAVALAVGSTATADPLRPPKAVTIDVTCTGLGPVTITNLGPAHTAAFQVIGSNTIILVPLNGAPGILNRALAAGTTCTEVSSGFTVPVVIVNG